MTVCVEANFSKTAEINKTPFTEIKVRLKLSSMQQTDQKSVHSKEMFQKQGTVPDLTYFDRSTGPALTPIK